MLVAAADADGAGAAAAAADALLEGGFSSVLVVEGGYAGWREKYTTSGRKTPPKGRWISTGKEALKSGLNVGDAALKYEELLNVDEVNTRDQYAGQIGGELPFSPSRKERPRE